MISVFVCLMLVLPGCATWQVGGGPDGINETFSQGEFIAAMKVQTADSPSAQKALKKVKAKRDTVIGLAASSVSLTVVSVLMSGLGGRSAYMAESGSPDNSMKYYAASISTAIAALILAGTQWFVGPSAGDYANVLLEFNRDYPNRRFVSYDLGVF
jgi:hypothetical protein